MNSTYNKKDIKNSSSDFRTYSNRLLNSTYDTMDNNLKRFILFIESNDLIKEYLISLENKYSDFNIENDISQVSYNEGFKEYLNFDEETTYSYQILKYIVNNEICYRKYVGAYSHSNNFNDMVKAFNDKFVLPFINNVNRYFERICVEMGLDENSNYYITNNGGQINISKDNSILNATQNNYNEVDKLVETIRNEIDTISDEEIKQEVLDNVEGIQEELKKEDIKKGRVKAFISSLNNAIPKFGTAIEIAAATTELITFAQNFIK